MLRFVILALACASTLSYPLAPPGTAITHHTTTAHHGIGHGLGYGGLGGLGYPGTVMKHTESVSSGYHGFGHGYGYPGLAGLGGFGYGGYGAYGAYPAAKQVTHVSTTAHHGLGLGHYGYY